MKCHPVETIVASSGSKPSGILFWGVEQPLNCSLSERFFGCSLGTRVLTHRHIVLNGLVAYQKEAGSEVWRNSCQPRREGDRCLTHATAVSFNSHLDLLWFMEVTFRSQFLPPSKCLFPFVFYRKPCAWGLKGGFCCGSDLRFACFAQTTRPGTPISTIWKPQGGSGTRALHGQRSISAVIKQSLSGRFPSDRDSRAASDMIWVFFLFVISCL